MKKLLYLFICVFCISCTKNNSVTIEVANPSNFDRSAELIEIPLSDINSRLSVKTDTNYIVKNSGGTIVPSQVTSDNKLIFQSELKANEKKSYSISVGQKQAYETKTWIAHHPERYGDLALENDRIGFRLYGKELKAIQAPMSGFDLWFKRTPKIVIDEWYVKELSKEASYHVDHGEGCDPYTVGQTLGAGNMAIMNNDTIILNQNFDEYEILDNGPLRTTFKVTYPVMNLNGEKVSEVKTISLDAGSQLAKVIQDFSVTTPTTLATGFPKRVSNDSIVYTKGNNYFIYEEPKDSINGQIYLGIVIPLGIDDVAVNYKTRVDNTSTILDNSANVIAKATYKPEEPLTYYTGFGWSKYGFNNVGAFDEYMNNFSAAIDAPLQITYK